jgi:hypothetical protein
MKRLIFMLGLLLIFIVPQAYGATTSPYPNPYRQTIWNNVTDAVHTFGKNAPKTKATLKKLHTARARARLQSIGKARQAKMNAQMQSWINSRNNS